MAINDSTDISVRAFRTRLAIIGTLGLAALLAVFSIPPFPQDTAYHDFADQRPLFGVPHCLNVLSNTPFIVFGLLGVIWLLTPSVRRSESLFATSWQWWAFVALFVFVTLTGFGSAYYHSQPNNATLFWDRLPLTVVFMTFFALVIADRVSPRWGAWLWLPLVAAGVFGVSHWQWTELSGAGDVRLYALVQFFPLAVIPILLLAFPGRYYRTADLFAILGWYGVAKVLELTDGLIYSVTGAVSGHTLKHLAASLGALWLLFLLKNKRHHGESRRDGSLPS